ncbi:class I lanthipeptide [Lacinutrix sp. Hel_I_90]|uniref:class I lanthipeptide n=1 Tax=Lacinutrix sp. Hel_I_90 TaxID=1249999 RepID=UPI0005CB5B40|nr:class I lanthipeptide [Lacinutrix sp. Hel_I_90]
MNKQNKNGLHFSKHVITELNETEVSKVNGGTSPMTLLSCSFCISSSNGNTGNLSITGSISIFENIEK